MSVELERRVFATEIELRIEGEDKLPVIEGYAAVFNETSLDLGGFRERIAPGAFAEAIAQDDVRALLNHDANYVLGRNRSGTLEMQEDERGLRVRIHPPQAQWAQDLVGSMQRGDIDQMSFGFVAKQDEWVQGVRELQQVRLYDVSVVTYPAYPQTSAAVRAMAAQIAGGEIEDVNNGNQAVADDDQSAVEADVVQARHNRRKRQIEILKLRGE